jgi:CBS domain-containing protein
MYEFLEYQVADALTLRPVTVGRRTTLAEAEALFERHDFDCLPVVDEDGALVGVIGKLDFLRAFAFGNRTMMPRYEEIMQQPVESVMTLRPTTIAPDMNLTRVLQLMVETRHKSFPVTIGALLIGIVSRGDVVRALRRAATGERPATKGRNRHERSPFPA